MAHGRRKLFDLAQLARAPLAAEAVRRIDAIFDAERTINERWSPFFGQVVKLGSGCCQGIHPVRAAVVWG